MENKIRHFIVDLDTIDDEFSYDSEGHNKIIEIKKLLEELITLSTNH